MTQQTSVYDVFNHLVLYFQIYTTKRTFLMHTVSEI